MIWLYLTSIVLGAAALIYGIVLFVEHCLNNDDWLDSGGTAL